jgi:hypothetical protein
MKNDIIGILLASIFLIFVFSLTYSVNYELKHPQNSTKILEKEEEQKTKDFFDISVRDKLRIIMIDDCEYIYGCIGGVDGMLLTHKGNCKNPEHKGNK